MKPDPAAPGGFRAPRPGEIYKNALLAKTFRLLADGGRKGFYEGPVAQAIVDVTTSLGGFLTLEDLRRHGEVGSEITKAIPLPLGRHIVSHDGDATSAGGGGEEPQDKADDAVIDLWELPPNGQGIVAQIALGVLQELIAQGKVEKFKTGEHNSAR